MADISKIKVPNGTSYDVKDKNAIGSLAYEGHTLTVTTRDGQVSQYTTADTTYTASSATPAMDGTGAAGSSDEYARGDHVHPSDTSKANVNSPAFTGTPTAPTATSGTNTEQIATTAFVMDAFRANDAMVFKGTIGSSGATVSSLPNTHYQGWTYKVITAGTYAGKTCEIGDMIICVADGTSASNDHWAVVQTNIDGAVTGPASSTDAHVATFDGTSGKVIKDSGFTIGKSVPSDALFTDHTYESKAAASGGTAESLVTTGEKYNWNNKAPLDSPTFTGIPKAPTAAAGTNTTQIATTAFVKTAVDNAVAVSLSATDDGNGNVTLTLA